MKLDPTYRIVGNLAFAVDEIDHAISVYGRTMQGEDIATLFRWRYELAGAVQAALHGSDVVHDHVSRIYEQMLDLPDTGLRPLVREAIARVGNAETLSRPRTA